MFKKRVNRRRLQFESLESRNMLVVLAGTRIEVVQDPTSSLDTSEHDPNLVHRVSVRLAPDPVTGAGPFARVTVYVSCTPTAPNAAEGIPMPSVIVFDPDPMGNWDEWRTVEIKGANDTVDDGPIPYNIKWKSTSLDAAYDFGNANPVVGGVLTNYDDDLLARNDAGYSFPEMEAGQLGVHSLNVCANDQDLGGDGSWGITSVTLRKGQGNYTWTTREIRFRPASDWYGDFEFTYIIQNEFENTSVADATGTITNVADAPVVTEDQATTEEGQPVTVNVLANDSDVDNPPAGRPLNALE